jgi:sensor histidine kinase YesM
MIIQPLVENGIKHGLSPLIEGGKIRVEIRKSSIYILQYQTLALALQINNAFGTGIGLTNTKLILEKMYNSTLKITDNFPRGLKKFEILCKSNNC